MSVSGALSPASGASRHLAPGCAPNRESRTASSSFLLSKWNAWRVRDDERPLARIDRCSVEEPALSNIRDKGLLTRPANVAPDPRDLDVVLVDEPAILRHVAHRSAASINKGVNRCTHR